MSDQHTLILYAVGWIIGNAVLVPAIVHLMARERPSDAPPITWKNYAIPIVILNLPLFIVPIIGVVIWRWLSGREFLT